MGAAKFNISDGNGGLNVKSLRKSYRKRLVIRDVSMQLHRGEVVALLGPNGSGKTTCFYSIAGLVAPEAGQVSVDGKDVTRLPMYRRARLGVGYLPQEMSIFRGMNVENNIDVKHRRFNKETNVSVGSATEGLQSWPLTWSCTIHTVMDMLYVLHIFRECQAY